MRQTVFCILFAAATSVANAQHDMSGPRPASPGNAAFGTISEIVRMLDADPNTDWSRVNIEALRQHLIDMDLVLMTSTVKQRNVAGGVELDVTGTGATIEEAADCSRSYSEKISFEGRQFRRDIGRRELERHAGAP